VPELHEEGLIEPQVGAQLADLLRRRVLPQQKHHRVAHVLEEQKGNKGDRDHHNDSLQQTAKNECTHRFKKDSEGRC